MKKKAFTLVELLVVIGIISVLIGMLMPALTKARAASNKIACGSNLRQIHIAWTMYLDDNKGYHPRIRERVGPGVHAFWMHKLVGASGTSLTLVTEGIATRYLGTSKVLVCPTDSWVIDTPTSYFHGFDPPSMLVDGQEARASYGYVNLSYWGGGRFNYLTDDSKRNYDYGPGENVSNVHARFPKFYRKNLKKHGEWPVFMDADFPASQHTVATVKSMKAGREPTSQSGYLDRIGRARHNDWANVVYADGHVDGVPAGFTGFHITAGSTTPSEIHMKSLFVP